MRQISQVILNTICYILAMSKQYLMRFGSFLLILTLFVGFGLFIFQQPKISGAPPYGIPEEEIPEVVGPYSQWNNWQRPAGPATVTLQVGHWQNDQFPEELARLRGNTGASGGGKWEWEVNLKIAELTRDLLEQEGVVVTILPATVPHEHLADVFLAIHADGNENRSVRGYKFAGPWRDLTGKSPALVQLLDEHYARVTGIPYDDNITKNMRGYYAFSWWRFEHAIHPMTTAAIAETGFLTSPVDRRIIVDQPQLSAQAISQAILEYLRQQQLLPAVQG